MKESSEDSEPTFFGFDIEEKQDCVLPSFQHINWPSCNVHSKQSSYCWAILLDGLKNYVETGMVIPFEDRD